MVSESGVIYSIVLSVYSQAIKGTSAGHLVINRTLPFNSCMSYFCTNTTSTSDLFVPCYVFLRCV